MNFLAHSYLSFNHSDILAGNMISDFVKGKKKFDYPASIQQGIVLHRQIDAFTDAHEATKQANTFLKPAVGLYAGAFTDVVYDHFLANDPNEFSDVSLAEHASATYQVLTDHFSVLPEVFQKMLPHMRSHNWLYNYKSMLGTQRGFGGVAHRAKYLDSSTAVFDLFQKHYDDLRSCYNAFFPLVKAFSIGQIEELR